MRVSDIHDTDARCNGLKKDAPTKRSNLKTLLRDLLPLERHFFRAYALRFPRIYHSNDRFLRREDVIFKSDYAAQANKRVLKIYGPPLAFFLVNEKLLLFVLI